MEKKINIFNTENYLQKEILSENKTDICILYINLILEYIKYVYEVVKIKNKNYYYFIVNRGILCIEHIFKFLLLYTRNVTLIEYHIKKTYLYYIEFVGQISEDNNSYLQLTSKDAMLFVYKKTIFDINTDFKKKEFFSSGSKKDIMKISNFMKNVNMVYYYFFKNFGKYDKVYDKLKKILYKYSKLYMKKNMDIANIIDLFILNLINFDLDSNYTCNYLRLFVNKLNKSKFDIVKMKSKIESSEEKIKNISDVKYVNYLFNVN